MTQSESVSVKLNRKLIPVAQTRDAFRKIFGAYSQTEFTGLMAEQYANAMQLEMVNTGLAACCFRPEEPDCIVCHRIFAWYDQHQHVCSPDSPQWVIAQIAWCAG